jgi:hypothetical protein
MDSIEDASGNARPKQWLDVCMLADKKVMEAQLEVKDAQLEVKDAQLVAEKAEKVYLSEKEELKKQLAVMELEKRLAVLEEREQARTYFRAQLDAKENELAAAKEKSAAKDVQIAKLQLQLDKLQGEGDGGHHAKFRRLGQTKMNETTSFFPRLVASKWRNDLAGVNSFYRLATTADGGLGISGQVGDLRHPKLRTALANAIDDDEDDEAPDAKYRAFGFCYKGPVISPRLFAKSGHVKEAYGVKVDDMNYVCVISFKRMARMVSCAANLPYCGLLPFTISPELVPGCTHHLSVYRPTITTDDPVLEMLKRPSMDKWFWHSG